MEILLCGSLWYYVLILDWMKTLMVVSLWVYSIKDLNEWVVYVIACVWNSNPRRQFVKWIMPRISILMGGCEGRDAFQSLMHQYWVWLWPEVYCLLDLEFVFDIVNQWSIEVDLYVNNLLYYFLTWYCEGSIEVGSHGNNLILYLLTWYCELVIEWGRFT